jgi:3-methyladenine DNA glycosylase/8-oxoguanine DNA glycosylase
VSPAVTRPTAGLTSAAGAPEAVPGGLTRRWRVPFRADLALTLRVHRRGPGDPAYRVDASGAVWRTSRTPDGPATLRVTAGGAAVPGAAGVSDGRPGAAGVSDGRPGAAGVSDFGAGDGGAGAGTLLHAAAWGPGAAWLLGSLPGLLGAEDDRAGFQPAHPLLAELDRRYQHLRIGRSARVLEALVPAVLEQKVVGAEARRAWRWLMLKYGERAPGPAPDGMRVFPPPRTWARIPSWDWHRAGVEGVRARTIIGACQVAGRLEEIAAMTSAEADLRLRSLPGIGPWTSAETRQRACGDADAVSVGDVHLPGAVGWALAGRIVDDAGMLDLLAPYAGHRHRATRLVVLSGLRPPRRGPRLAPRDYRSF